MGKKSQKRDANKKEAEEYSYKEISALGKCFLDAAQKCNEPKIEDVGWSHYLLVPIITNMAFACELFLKAILKYGNIEIKTHNLMKLFDGLQKDVKREIVNLQNEENFRRRLANISNLFEEWRYLYERYPSYIEYKFLCDFSGKLLKIVDKIESDAVLNK